MWSCGQSRQNTALACGVGKTTVTDTVARAKLAGLQWHLPAIDDEALERLLYPPVLHPVVRNLPQPDWKSLHDELVSQKDLTFMLLWQEYKERQPELSVQLLL